MGFKAFFKIRVFIPIIISLFFIIINPTRLRDSLFRFIIPFKLIGIKIRGVPSYLNATMKDNIMLRKENERLREKITLLLYKHIKTDEVFQQNQRLRKILEFKEKVKFRPIVANILGFDPSFSSSIIIIDRGIEDGIKKGSCVISPFKGKGVFIGKVYRVFPSSSIVLLTTDPSFLTPGRLKNTGEKGLLKGMTNKMELLFIERETPVRIGEPVITIPDAFTPADFLIGYVKNIKERGGLFKKIFVKPAISFSRLYEVLVVDYNKR